MKGGNKMKEMKEMNEKYMVRYMNHTGSAMFILGGLILLNVYVMKLGWGTFVGGIFVLIGLAKMGHGCKK